jgi:hypothetical protein
LLDSKTKPNARGRVLSTLQDTRADGKARAAGDPNIRCVARLKRS